MHEATVEPNILICWASGSPRFLTHCICVYVVCAMVCLCVFTVNVFACDFVLCSHVCVLMFCTGGSQKLEALVKTGRFGIGFNSCYHICEMPTFLSRDRLVMFDPQTKYLPDVNANNPGKCINVRGSLLPFSFLPSFLPPSYLPANAPHLPKRGS